MYDRITPVNKALIIANVVVFGLQQLFAPYVDLFFSLWPPVRGESLFAPWQLLTYGFLHGSLMHLAFNMLTLFMFGSEVERLFGTRRYLIYYLACVVGAALMHLIVLQVAGMPPVRTVGASGAVFGLLLAYGMAYPHRKLFVIPIPVPISAWLLVTLYGLCELYLGVTGTASGVAHFAHLGGMATGFVIIRYWRAQALRRQ
jgi:membrane associated rhomboid family serine protease